MRGSLWQLRETNTAETDWYCRDKVVCMMKCYVTDSNSVMKCYITGLDSVLYPNWYSVYMDTEGYIKINVYNDQDI